MREITLRKNLISELKNLFNQNDSKYNIYMKICNVLNNFDCENDTYYADDFRELSDLLDEDDVYYWLNLACKDGIDRVRCFINDTYSDDIYKLDGYNNLSNVSESDLRDAVDDVINNIESDIEDLKQEEM